MNYRMSKGCRYAGAKGKCGEIIPIIQGFLQPGGTFWDAMCGSGKIVQGVACKTRIATDIDEPIITLQRAVRNGWEPPSHVSEAEYKLWMEQRGETVDPMMGFVGYGCSFGARYFQGYARSRSGTVNFAESARRALLRQRPFISDVYYYICDYREYLSSGMALQHPFPDVAYFDIPYKGTKRVGGMKPFNYRAFYSYARMLSKHCVVLISEYHCPLPEAEIVWETKVAAGLRFDTHGDGSQKGSGRVKIERLYCLRPGISNRIGLGVL